MSSTSPSYIDDGRSFTRRIPPPSLANVSHWLHTTHGSSDNSSTYTGSYIDDGLDLLPANVNNNNTPGFGPIDRRFYAHKKRRDKDDGAWNADIARAISGDIHASLSKLNRVAGVELKRPSADSEEEKRRSEEKRGVVSVRAPLQWGTFVIKGDDGRVVVVDERGEYDSGVAGQREGKRESKRWVKAGRSPSPPAFEIVPAVELPTESASEERGAKEKRSKTRSGSKVRTSRTSRKKRRPRALSPVPESVYDSDDPVKPAAASPTDFFMTGGLSGWPSPSKPSRASSPEPPSGIVPHAITWDTSTSPYTYDSCSKSASKFKSGSHSARTLAARLALSTRVTCKIGLQLYIHVPQAELEKDGQEAVSNYQPPDIIEVTYDETPPGEAWYSQAGWNDGKALSAQSWGAAADEEKIKGSDMGWGWSAKGSGWAEDGAQSKTESVHDRSRASRRSNDSSTEWDGFECPKTTSEVSVAGGSDRSWPASQYSIHTVQTHRTQRSHTSRRSSGHSSADWPASRAASQAGSAVQSEQNWPASAHGSSHSKLSWPKTRHGSDKSSPSTYPNGFDEDNATYLNETWGGIPVRVASPHKSAAGWD